MWTLNTTSSNLAGQHLDRPVVRADSRDLLVVQPFAAGHAEARLAGHERRRAFFGEELSPPARAKQEDVAGANLDALPLRSGVEVLRRDHLAHFEPLDAFQRHEVEQDAAPGDALALLIDGVMFRAVQPDIARREAVVHLVVVVHMREAVPLRGTLQRHEDVVVGVLEAAREALAVARLRHQVDRVDAPAARLRAIRIHGDAKVEDLALLDELRGRNEPLGRDQVRRPAFILGAPRPQFRSR